MRTITAIAVAAMLVLAGCSQVPGMDDSTSDPATGSQGPDGTGPDGEREVRPPDPGEDVLGWESGYWYNETVSVDRSDGLNGSEMDAVVVRSMARVERIRGLEFEKEVPVNVVSRSEFQDEHNGGKTPPNRALFDNAKFEALFMIDESTDSIAVQNRNTGNSVAGYYSPKEESIVIVSNNEKSPKMNEITLSQELFHALQDQKFGFDSFDQSTRERHNAVDGVIEGDGNYVDYLYERRCNGEWQGSCLMPNSDDEVAGGELANIGPYLVKFQPYSDGPAFVKSVRDEGGWEAVNALYENPPASTEQVIHSAKYPDEKPADVTVTDRTRNGWERLEPEGRPNVGELGEAGIYSMFMYPYYDSEGETQIVPAMEFFNTTGNGQKLDDFDPLNYDGKPSNGWNGDALAVYTKEGTPRNETGYVWKLRWDSEGDAREFFEAYRELLSYNGAKPVDGRTNTWRIPDGNGFGDAFYVQRTGDTVVIVNAPSVSDLSDVRRGSAPRR